MNAVRGILRSRRRGGGGDLLAGLLVVQEMGAIHFSFRRLLYYIMCYYMHRKEPCQLLLKFVEYNY